MRIPSQFNDSSLYRPRQGGKNAGKRSHVPAAAGQRRRLIRLVAALALVIVVMREAGQPGIYQTFFGEQKTDWVPMDAPITEPNSLGGSPPSPATRTPAPKTPATSLKSASPESHGESPGDSLSVGAPPQANLSWDAAARWVDAMSLDLQRAWIQWLVAARHAAQQPQNDDSQQIGNLTPERLTQEQLTQEQLTQEHLKASIATLRSLPVSETPETATAARRDEVLRDLERMGSDPDSAVSAATWQQISWWSIPLLSELDRAALNRVADGTFWTGRDSDAFYLQLASVDWLDSNGAMQTGTLPLLQQPDVYQGKLIAVVGRLQLGQKIDAAKNRLGFDHYWKLWIIPNDGGVRPTVLITADLPVSIQNSLDAAGNWNAKANPANPDGQIQALGRFIKRIPYRSSIGADLAPVVIGEIVAAKGVVVASTSSRNSSNPTNDSRQTDAWIQGWGGIAIAIAAGIILAAALMYRTSIDAKRSRALRNRSLESIEIQLPSAPEVSAPEVSAPEISGPEIGNPEIATDTAVTDRQDGDS